MADDTRLLFPDLLVDHLQDLVLKTQGVKEMLDESLSFPPSPWPTPPSPSAASR